MSTFCFVINLIIIFKAYECSIIIPIKAFVENCQLPKGCKWNDKNQWLLEETIVCKNLYSTINLDKCNLTNKTSDSTIDLYALRLVFNEMTDNHYILNNDFNLHKIIDFINASIFSIKTAWSYTYIIT